ncbi:MAG: phosphotransferase family protein [Candidatus Kariarchaeaceae archaeon]|jgi:aminoglycoside phosphotransferase (APT) family kinase protein
MQAFEVAEGLTDYYTKAYTEYEEVVISNVTRMTEGWETIVYAYNLSYFHRGRFSKDLIIRFYPGSDGAEKAVKEFNLMASLMMTTIQVPDPYRLETESNLGMPFIIMEKIVGELMSNRILEDQANLDWYLTNFALTLVEIHTVDFQTMIHRSDTYKGAETPYKYLAQQLTGYKDRIEMHNKPEFIPVLRWLVERMDTVPNNRLSLLHGDFHLANVMIDNDKDLYVIDWIDASIGDFRVDLAWTLLLHEINLGKPIRDTILNTYTQNAPFPVEEIKYFEVLAILRQLLDLSINFNYQNEMARLNPNVVDHMKDNLEPVKRSLRILYGHTHIKIPEFEQML